MFGKNGYHYKKFTGILVLVCCLLMVTATALAATQDARWRLDAREGSVLPRSLRFMTDDFANPVDPMPSRQGLEKLRCSASAEFSGAGLALLGEEIRARVGKEAVIYVVDLRKESHGFVNGDIPVSSHVERNWGNYELNTPQVLQAEKELLQSIEGQELTFVPMGNTDTKILTARTVKVEKAQPEEAIASALGLHYKRIAVTDQAAPTDENVDEFMEFYQSLPKNAWLHFHCHAGHGRTTSFMVFYDILENPGVPLKDIAARQYALGGTNLLADSDRDDWRGQEIRKRADLIRKFYDYVQANRSTDFQQKFSEWVAKSLGQGNE